MIDVIPYVKARTKTKEKAESWWQTRCDIHDTQVLKKVGWQLGSEVVTSWIGSDGLDRVEKQIVRIHCVGT